MRTLRPMFTASITINIFIIALVCQVTTARRASEDSKRTPVLPLAGTRDSQSEGEKSGVLFQEHGEEYGRSMRVQPNKLEHVIRVVKRAAELKDATTKDSERRDERRRLLQQRYRLFRQRKLGRKKQSPRNEKPPHLNLHQKDSKSSVVDHNKRPKMSAKSYSDPSRAKSNESDKKPSFQHESKKGKVKPSLRPKITHDAQRKNYHKSRGAYHPYLPVKRDIFREDKTEGGEKLVKTDNKSPLRNASDFQKFQDYKSKHRERLKLLRERPKFKTTKSKIQNSQRNKINLPTDSASPTVATLKNNESAKAPKVSKKSTTPDLTESQTMPANERHLSEITTRSPFVDPTRAFDYLTSFESTRKPKRWPVRLLLPSEEMPSSEKPLVIKDDPPSLIAKVELTAEAPLSVSERESKDTKQPISTRELHVPKKKKKRERKGSGNKTGKRKSKRSSKKGEKRKTNKRSKKRRKELRKQKYLKTTTDSSVISSTKTAEPLSPTYTTKITYAFFMAGRENRSNVEASPTSSADQKSDFLNGDNDVLSLEKNVTAHPTTDYSTISSIQHQTRVTTKDEGDVSDDDEEEDDEEEEEAKEEEEDVSLSSQINYATKSGEVLDLSQGNSLERQNSTNSTLKENSEFNGSSLELTNSSFLSEFRVSENVTSLLASEPAEMNNVTKFFLQNASLNDELPAYSENDNDTVSKSMTDTHIDTNTTGVDQPSFSESSPNGSFTELVETDAPVTNKLSRIDSTLASQSSTSSYLSSSSSSLPPSSSSSSKYDSSSSSSQTSPFYSSRMTSSTFPSTSAETSSSLSSSPSPSLSSSPFSLQSSSPSSTTTAASLPPTQSSISRWRQWALKRRQKANQDKKTSPWGRKKGSRRWGSRRKKKNDKTKKYVQGRGSVAGSLVVMTPASPTPSQSPTESTKSPFIGYKTAYDFLSGQKGIRKDHGSEKRRKSYELNRLMAENMCETFGRHFVPTSIGGKCV